MDKTQVKAEETKKPPVKQLVKQGVKPNVIKKVPQKRVHNYLNETALFKIFCICRGNVEKMVNEYSQDLPPEEAKLIPKTSKLYDMANKFGWRTRMAELKDVFHDVIEDEEGISFESLATMAKLVSRAYTLKVHENIKESTDQSINKNVRRNLRNKITHKDLNAVWGIMRTERGLPTNITHRSIEATRTDVMDGIIEEEAGLDFVDAVNNVPAQVIATIFAQLKLPADEPPKFLNKPA